MGIHEEFIFFSIKVHLAPHKSIVPSFFHLFLLYTVVGKVSPGPAGIGSRSFDLCALDMCLKFDKNYLGATNQKVRINIFKVLSQTFI